MNQQQMQQHNDGREIDDELIEGIDSDKSIIHRHQSEIVDVLDSKSLVTAGTNNAMDDDIGMMATTSIEQPPPIPPLREDMVYSAVQFLRSPQVHGSSITRCKTFLSQKGLTDAEIVEALHRIGHSPNDVDISNGSSSIPPPLPSRSLLPISQQQQQYYEHQQHDLDFGQQNSWKDVALAAVLVGGVTYTCVQLWKRYIVPRIRRATDDITSVNNKVESLSECVSVAVEQGRTTQNTLDSVQSALLEDRERTSKSISEMNNEISNIKSILQQQQSSVVVSENRALADLRTELVSLKGLLLNRHQFAPSPIQPAVMTSNGNSVVRLNNSVENVTRSPIHRIPAWQRANGSGPSAETEDSESVTDTSITADILKDECSVKNNGSPSRINGKIQCNGNGNAADTSEDESLACSDSINTSPSVLSRWRKKQQLENQNISMGFKEFSTPSTSINENK